jgi:hypothetical protein
MPVLTWLSHHRFWILGLGVTTLVALVLAGVWFFLIRSPGTQIDLRQALRLYRQGQQVKGGDPSVQLPPPGVYRYRTSGSEQLSVGGINRTFPSTTEMVVTDAGCATMTWYPLEQHTEGVVVCSAGHNELLMNSALSEEEIAGIHTNQTLRCSSGAFFVPADPSVGETWNATCRGAGERVTLAGRVVARSSVNVGGQEIPALHTRLTLSFNGSETGTNPTDYWVSTQNGLILAERETVDVKQGSGPLGSVQYHERMALAIDATSPDR